jgi:hypothetical protein
MDESKLFARILLTPDAILFSTTDKEDKNDDNMKPTNIPAANQIDDPVRCRDFMVAGAMYVIFVYVVVNARIVYTYGVKRSEECNDGEI